MTNTDELICNVKGHGDMSCESNEDGTIIVTCKRCNKVFPTDRNHLQELEQYFGKDLVCRLKEKLDMVQGTYRIP